MYLLDGGKCTNRIRDVLMWDMEDKSDKNNAKILAYLLENKGQQFTPQQIAKAIGSTVFTVRYLLGILEGKKALTRVGDKFTANNAVEPEPIVSQWAVLQVKRHPRQDDMDAMRAIPSLVTYGGV